MNVFLYEWRTYIKSSCVWALSLALFGIVCISLFQSFTKDIATFESMLKAYPPSLLQAMGVDLSFIKSFNGFYAFCFLYIALIAAIQSMYMGMHIIAKEMSNKSSEFLFCKPLNRSKILLAKLGSISVCICIVNIIYHACIYAFVTTTQINVDRQILFYIHLSLLFTQLLFLAIGFMIGSLCKKIKSVLTITAGIVAAFFLIEMVVNLDPQGIVAYFSLFHYASANQIVLLQGFDVPYLCVGIVVITMCIFIAFIGFKQRDISN